MPSSENKPLGSRPTGVSANSAGKIAETSAVRRTNAQLNKREARSAQRAAYRRRRNTVLSVLATIVVLAALAVLLVNHWPFTSTSAKGSSTAAKGACPTATTSVGPAPVVTPPATPPPTTAKTVSDQGLQYIDITSGCGSAVKAGDTVTVNYTGWLASTGKLFDSSLESGRTPFQVQNVGQAQVIQGWNIGLVGMKVGETRRLIIPPSLGYGPQANGPIPANSTLIFDVTLVSIDSSQSGA